MLRVVRVWQSFDLRPKLTFHKIFLVTFNSIYCENMWNKHRVVEKGNDLHPCETESWVLLWQCGYTGWGKENSSKVILRYILMKSASPSLRNEIHTFIYYKELPHLCYFRFFENVKFNHINSSYLCREMVKSEVSAIC